jgi:flagellar biogenesis protein FliO
MGVGASTNLSTAVSELMYDQTTTIINNTSVSVKTVSSDVNTISISDGIFTGCTVDLTQTINSETTSAGQVTSDTRSDITTKLTDTLNSHVDQSSKSENKGFFSGLFRADVQTNSQLLKDAIKENISTTMESNAVVDICTETLDRNFAELKNITFICTPENKIKFDQNIFSRSSAVAIVDQVVKNLMDNETVKKFTNDTKQSISLLNIGITIGGIIAVIILLVIVYYAYKKISSGKGVQQPNPIPLVE